MVGIGTVVAEADTTAATLVAAEAGTATAVAVAVGAALAGAVAVEAAAVGARLRLELPLGGGEDYYTLGLKLCPPRVFTMARMEREKRWRGWEEERFQK